MFSVAHSLSRRLFKPLALSLAVLSFFFLVGVFPHAHANTQEEATCTICQVAHLGVTPAVTAVIQCAPLVNSGQIVAVEILVSAQVFSSHSLSRAPPSLLA